MAATSWQTALPLQIRALAWWSQMRRWCWAYFRLQAARRRLVSPGSADALEALGLVPGSFLADLHSRSPMTASLSKALYELPCIDAILHYI